MVEIEKAVARRRAKVEKDCEKEGNKKVKLLLHYQYEIWHRCLQIGLEKHEGSLEPSHNKDCDQNGTSNGEQLEKLKEEIMKETREEVNRAKQEIIDGELFNLPLKC